MDLLSLLNLYLLHGWGLDDDLMMRLRHCLVEGLRNRSMLDYSLRSLQNDLTSGELTLTKGHSFL